jgi:tetratricopeptide (TPR) repeat protein
MKMKSVILLVPALLVSLSLFGQAPTMGPPAGQSPMTDKEVLSELKKSGPDQLTKDVGQRGVDFEMNDDIEKRLRKAKATDQVIAAVKAAGPKERETATRAAAQAAGAIEVPKEEETDFKAIQGETDPDKSIALCEDFAKKHPNSPVLSYVYSYEANAYQTKGDVINLVEAAKHSVFLKKDNLMSLMMLSYAIPTPQYIHEHGGDEEKQLTDAESYNSQAVAAVAGVKKQQNETDDAFAKRKAEYLAELHADEGMVHLNRAQEGLVGLDKNELAKAEQEYKLAVTGVDNPDPSSYYRLGEACRLQGKYDDALAAFTKASQLGKGTVKEYADQQIAKVKEAQAQAGAAKP